MMKLQDLLLPWVDTRLPDLPIHAVENDSRQITQGALFLAYPGAEKDGRDFIDKAIEAGAVAVAYECSDRQFNLQHSQVVMVPIENLSDKLIGIAQRFYPIDQHALSVVGITGTNGKTTIAYLLAQAYHQLNEQGAYIGTLGEGQIDKLNKLANTTPDSLVLQKLFHQYQAEGIHHIAMETSSHALAQNRVGGVKFNQAIYTNLSQDHLDFHTDMDDYAQAKASLFAYASLQFAIVNIDDPYVETMLKQVRPGCQVYTYGFNPQADIHALDMNTSQQGMSFNIASPWGDYCVQTQLIGQFNLYNVMAVFASLACSGHPAEQVVDIIRHLKPSPGRMELVCHQPQVIVDFAHSPDALHNVLKTIRQLTQGRIIIVFGCGGERDRSKRPLMGKVASQMADYVIMTNDNPRHEDPNRILAAIQSGVEADTQYQIIPDRRKAIEKAIELAGEKDVILVAGKGHEDYQIMGDKMLHFSDKQIIRSFVNCVGNI